MNAMPHRASQAVELMGFNTMFYTFLYIPFVLFWNDFADKISILLMFIFLDFILGLWASLVLKEKLSFFRFYAGVLTKFTTLLLPFLLYFFSKGATEYANQIDLIIPSGLSLLIAIEFYSILGNIYAIRTKTHLEKLDWFSIVVFKLRKIIEAFLKAFKS